MKKREKKQRIKKPKDPRPFAQRHPKWNTFFAFIILILLGIGAFFLLKIPLLRYNTELGVKLWIF